MKFYPRILILNCPLQMSCLSLLFNISVLIIFLKFITSIQFVFASSCGSLLWKSLMEVSCGSLCLKSPVEDFCNSVIMHHSIELHFFHLHTFLMKSLMEDFSHIVANYCWIIFIWVHKDICGLVSMRFLLCVDPEQQIFDNSGHL